MKLKEFIFASGAATGLLLAYQVAKARRQLGSQLEDCEIELIDTEDLPDVISFVMMGDSLAVGLGASNYHETPGILISKILTTRLNSSVKYHNVAASGAIAIDLYDQTLQALVFKPDITVIVIGTNDITHAKSTSAGIRALRDSIVELHNVGSKVYAVPCIDLSMVSAINEPLRSLLGIFSRKYARVQRETVLGLGATVIDTQILIKQFNNDSMFSIDKFHPSSSGYQLISHVIAEQILAM